MFCFSEISNRNDFRVGVMLAALKCFARLLFFVCVLDFSADRFALFVFVFVFVLVAA